MHVGMHSHPRDILGPPLHSAARHRWFRQVIDNGSQVRHGIEHACDPGQMTGKRENIERRTRGCQMADIGQKRRAQDIIVVRLVLQHGPQPDEFRTAHQRLKLDGKRRVLEIEPADHAGNKIRIRRQRKQEIRLGLGLRGLDEHGPVDTGAPQDGTEVVREIVACQDGHIRRHPVIVTTIRPPQMMMRVDDQPASPCFGRPYWLLCITLVL